MLCGNSVLLYFLHEKCPIILISTTIKPYFYSLLPYGGMKINGKSDREKDEEKENKVKQILDCM